MQRLRQRKRAARAHQDAGDAAANSTGTTDVRDWLSPSWLTDRGVPASVWKALHRKLDVTYPHHVGPVGVFGVHEIEHLTRDHGELFDVGGPVAATLELG